MTEDMRWSDDITDSMDLSLSKLQESLCCNPWGHKELGTTEQLNDNKKVIIHYISVQYSVGYDF